MKARILALFIAPMMFGCQLTGVSLQGIDELTNNTLDSIAGTNFKFNESVIANIDKTRNEVLSIATQMPKKWENSDKKSFDEKLLTLERTTPEISLREENNKLFPIPYNGSVCYPEQKNTDKCLSSINDFMKEVKEITGEDISDKMHKTGRYVSFSPSKEAVRAIQLKAEALSDQYKAAKAKNIAKKQAADEKKKQLAQEKIHNKKMKQFETEVKKFQKEAGLDENELTYFCLMFNYEEGSGSREFQQNMYLGLRQLYYERYGLRKFQSQLEKEMEQIKNLHEETYAKLSPLQQSSAKDICEIAIYGLSRQ